MTYHFFHNCLRLQAEAQAKIERENKDIRAEQLLLQAKEYRVTGKITWGHGSLLVNYRAAKGVPSLRGFVCWGVFPTYADAHMLLSLPSCTGFK